MVKTAAICVTNDTSRDQRIQRIAKSLSGAGYKVTLIGAAQRASTTIKSDYTVVLLNPKKQSGPLFYIHYNYLLSRFLSRNKFDIIITCDPDTLLGSYRAIRKNNCIGIYDAHEYYIESPELVNRKIVRFIWDTIERNFTKRHNYFITVNAILASILSDRLNRPFHVVRNLPILKTWDESARDEIIIYQGMLNIGRGLSQAIEMMKFLLQKYQLHIVGDGTLKQKLLALSNRLDLNQRVVFHGQIPPSNLHQLTSKAKIGLNLLEDKGLNYKYSLANKFFDYMMAGVPSLSPNFPLYASYCKEYECGSTIDTLDPQLLAQKVIEMSLDPQYSHMRNKCKIHREHLNWNAESQVVLDLLSNF